MSDNPSAYEAMKALRDQIEKRLLENEDYRAFKALDRALSEVSLSEDKEAWAKFGSFISGKRPTARLNVRVPLSQADAAFEVMKRYGSPVPISDLVQLVRDVGVAVGGNDPQINLSSTLSKDSRFRSVRFKGRAAWWLSSMPYIGELAGDSSAIGEPPEEAI